MNVTKVSWSRMLVVLGVLYVGSMPVATAGTTDSWYVIKIAGSPVGSVHSVVEMTADATLEKQSMRLVLNRMGSLTEMASISETREDAAGSLLSASMELEMSSQSTNMKAVIEPGRVRIADGAGEATFNREIDYEGQLLGPVAARRLMRESLKEVGDRVDYRTFRPDLGGVVDIGIELMGLKNGHLEVRETISGMPIATTYWLDGEASIVRSTMPSPFGEMETVLADAAIAKLATVGNELPDEIYGATLARTQVRLPEPRRAERVVLEIRHRNPALGWPELSIPGQTILEQDHDRLLLEVQRREDIRPARFPVEVTDATAEFLEANAYIQSDDSRAAALAREIVGDTSDVFSAMEALERWTAENMRFDMGVVMAPSSEVLENRAGTCTEYAVLLTTLARSLGIPARFVMGYVYVGGIYGGHAWTEVLIGDQWVGFDGAVPAEGPVDAARIAFLWSSLAEGIGSLHVGPGMQMYGQIDLAVLEYELEGGQTTSYSAKDDGVEIDGHTYRNRALGVTWSIPAGFSFSRTDLTWPETDLVGIEGPEGLSATLSVQDRKYWLNEGQAIGGALKGSVSTAGGAWIDVGGHRARLVESQDRAALALVRGSELWVLEVEAPEAGSRLRQLADELRL